MARKILLADDSVTAQNMGRKILADAGYEVITVNNGSAALKKIAEQKPDVIVLDVYMPGYSGLEVCQRLKEAHETSRIPVLLTVGKLEPFKPEEARRARADGFIVKPFEASELLSALTKLEDKVVPRSETRPGRLARATAAIEGFDRTVASDEDSGWRSRLSFPSKKKEKAQPAEDGDDPAIYNAVNKDLRTVVEHKPLEKPHEAKPYETPAREEQVDLGALAPEGLPKDVTPEEIAALAAAAAQVKGKIAESRAAEPTPQETGPLEVAASEPKPVEKAESRDEEGKPDTKIEIPPVVEPPQEPAAVAAPTTFAEHKPEDATAPPPEKPRETETEAADIAVPSPADVMAAIAGLEQAPAVASSEKELSSADEQADEPADEPVTMALAACAAAGATTSRWTAVSVALAPEEAALSLENEMQKAFAAFAAAEALPAGPVAVLAEPTAPTALAAEPPSPVDVAAVPTVLVAEAPAPEAAQSLTEAASAATDAVTPTVKEFETVAPTHVEEATSIPAEPKPVDAATAEVAPQPAPEPAPIIEAKTEESEPHEKQSSFAKAEPEETAIPAVEATASPDATKTEESKEELPHVAHEELKAEEPRYEPPKYQESKNENEEQKYEAPVAAVTVATPEQPELSEAAAQGLEPAPSAVAGEVPHERASASEISSEIVSLEKAPEEPIEPAGGISDMAKKESEMAATTAAAWASWRRIRETGDSKSAKPAEPSKEDPSKEEVEQSSAPKDDAAMAVAAGSEHSPEEVPAASESDSEAIASIVDSVLADMRPKIVEEISRKLGKKK